MTRRTIESYPCECGKGNIELTKLHYNVLSEDSEGSDYSSIKPCPICAGTIDSLGRDLSKLLN